MMLPTWALLAVPAGFGVIGLWMAYGTLRNALESRVCGGMA